MWPTYQYWHYNYKYKDVISTLDYAALTKPEQYVYSHYQGKEMLSLHRTMQLTDVCHYSKELP